MILWKSKRVLHFYLVCLGYQCLNKIFKNDYQTNAHSISFLDFWQRTLQLTTSNLDKLQNHFQICHNKRIGLTLKWIIYWAGKKLLRLKYALFFCFRHYSKMPYSAELESTCAFSIIVIRICRTEEVLSKNVIVVRQGCLLCPDLFHILHRVNTRISKMWIWCNLH